MTVDVQKKSQATEMRCFRNLLGISYKEHITKEVVRDRIRQAMGSYDDTLQTLTAVKTRKFKLP